MIFAEAGTFESETLVSKVHIGCQAGIDVVFPMVVGYFLTASDVGVDRPIIITMTAGTCREDVGTQVFLNASYGNCELCSVFGQEQITPFFNILSENTDNLIANHVGRQILPSHFNAHTVNLYPHHIVLVGVERRERSGSKNSTVGIGGMKPLGSGFLVIVLNSVYGFGRNEHGWPGVGLVLDVLFDGLSLRHAAVAIFGLDRVP